MRLFFYGTLMDADIRAAVMGNDLAGHVIPATARGWRRVAVSGRPYPTLVAHRTGRVDGLAVMDVDDARMRALRAYEGPEYRLDTIAIALQGGENFAAATFLCSPGLRTPTVWRFADWLRRHKSASLARIGLNHTVLPWG